MADEKIKLEIESEYTGGAGEAAAKDLEKARSGMQGAGETAAQAAGQFDAFGESSGKAAGGAGVLRDALEKLPESTMMVAGSTEKMNEALDSASESTPKFSEALNAVEEPAKAASKQIDQVSSSVADFSEEMRPTLPVIESMQKGFTTLSEQATISAPAVSGVTDAFANMARTPVASFNEAVSVASKMSMPFTVLQNSIDAAGISWGDFVGQLSPEYQGRLQKLADNSLYAGESVNTLAKSYSGADAKAATFFGNVAKEGDALAGFGKGMEEVSSAAKGMSVGGIFSEIGGAFSQVSEGLMTLAMPIFAIQAIGMVVQAVSQGIYDAAALAEGPAAHTVGTFTGSVDQLTISAAKAGQVFSESFGKELIPDLQALNYSAQQGDFGQLGKDLGDITGIIAGPLAMFVGGTAMTVPGGGAIGQDIISAGWRMTANSAASMIGMKSPYVANTPTIDYAAIDAQMLQTAQQNYAMASDPQYMATAQSAAYLQFKQQQAIQQVAMYDVSHWSGSSGFNDPMNSVAQAEMVRASGQQYGMSQRDLNNDPNANYFYGLLGQMPYTNESSFGGCFPAGTMISMSNGSYKPIERVEVGEMVLSPRGPARVNDAFTYNFKGIYRVLFNNATILYVTDGHPVATPQGWKSINPITTAREHAGLSCSTLMVGDRVITQDGSQFAVESITISHIANEVYNLTVAGDHVYYASGFLVHNSKLSMSVADAVGNTQIPSNSLQNSDMMSSITANFSGLDLNKTFDVSIAWNVAGDLFHSFIGNPIWNTAGDLFHAFIGNPIWNTAGDLFHAFVGNPIWNTAGELFHAFIGNPIWQAAGELFHAFIGNPIWQAAGELFHSFIGNPMWSVAGDLAHVFSGNPIWQADGLTHLFAGLAQWEGKDLVHTFVAVANWVAQNLNPTFNVAAMFTGLPMFAGGIQNFGGGAAIVGERGPELVTLPAGSSVYPNDSLPSIGADAGSNLAGMFAGSGGSTGPLVLNVHFDSIQVANAILPQLAPIMHAQFGIMM